MILSGIGQAVNTRNRSDNSRVQQSVMQSHVEGVLRNIPDGQRPEPGIAEEGARTVIGAARRHLNSPVGGESGSPGSIDIQNSAGVATSNAAPGNFGEMEYATSGNLQAREVGNSGQEQPNPVVPEPRRSTRVRTTHRNRYD